MHLTEWARLQGVHPHTAYRWFQNGTLPTELDQVAGCAPERAPALAELAQPAATRLNSRAAATSPTTPFRRQMGRAGGPASPVIAIALLPTVSTPPSRF